MIDFNNLLDVSKHKEMQYAGGHESDMCMYNKEGCKIISSNSLRGQEFNLTDGQIATCNELTICTSIMDRTEHLLQAIPTWARLPFKRIVVLDWSSKEPVSEVLKNENINIPNLDVIRVDGKKHYHQAGAKNEKIKQCEGWVLCLDSDIMLSPCFGKSINIPKSKKVLYINDIKLAPKELQGTAIFHRDMFDEVGGFDELFTGWGSEDITFYELMTKHGCTVRDFRPHTAFHIPHDDFSRVVNVKYENMYESLVDGNYKRSLDIE